MIVNAIYDLCHQSADTITVNLSQLTATEITFQFHRWRTWTETNPDDTFTELKPITNLILQKKYTEPEQTRTFMIKEPEPKILFSFPSLITRSQDHTTVKQLDSPSYERHT